MQGGSLGNGTTVYGRDDVDSVIVVCFDWGTTDIKELLKKHKAKSRKIMDTIEERLVIYLLLFCTTVTAAWRSCILRSGSNEDES